MSVFALPGTLHLAPTNATTGGTAITGIAEDRTTFENGAEIRAFGGGLYDDDWVNIRVKGRPPALRLLLHDVSATARKLLYSVLSSGGSSLNSDGGNVPLFNGGGAYALVIRPVDTTQLYFYSPRMVLHPDSAALMVWSRLGGHFMGSELVLMPERSADGTKRAWMLDTAANINTHYGL